MFWGLIMQPGKKYTQIAERSFHLSMASLDIARLDTDDLKLVAWKDKDNTQEAYHNKNLIQVICHHNDRSYLMCNLNTTTLCQVRLNINFKKGERTTFSSTSPVNIHLTGYLLGKDFNECYESGEEQEEKPNKLMKRKAHKKLKNQTKLKRMKQLMESNSHNDIIDGFKLEQKYLSGNSESDEDTVECTIEDESSNEDEDSEESSKEDKDCEEQSTTSKQQKKKNKKIQEQPEPQKLKKERSAEICEFLKLASAKMQTAQEQKGKQKKTESPLKLSNGIKDKKDKIRKGGVKVHDIEVGHGPQAQVGKTVVMYSTSRLKNGKKIYSQTQGEGLKFKFGKGKVIKGLDIGLVGMKVGGKRRITIPPSMGFGANGYPPIVPPNSIIIYEVELKKVY